MPTPRAYLCASSLALLPSVSVAAAPPVLPAEAPSALDRKKVFAWALYDFGNSAFTTLVVTFIYSTYFARQMAPGNEGEVLWSRGVVVTALLVALLSPISGALADRGGFRKRYLLATTLVVIVATASLAFFGPAQALLALVVFVVANTMFELSGTFYNAFLPTIASQETMGRVSGYGWGFGYVGGLLCMALALVGFVGLSDASVPWFGLARDGSHIRATNLLVAAWMAVFCAPLFFLLPEQRATHAPMPFGQMLRASFAQLGDTFQHLKRYRQTVRLLVARLFYNDALTTIFSFGGIYAATIFGFTFTEIMYFGLALNVAAGLGGFLFGFIDDRVGGKTTILVSLVGLTLASGLAIAADTPATNWLGTALLKLAGLAGLGGEQGFALTSSNAGKATLWGAGILIGLFAGPNQSASRSLLGRFVPPGKTNEFFGFFNFSGKATSFLGPLLLGLIADRFSMREGVAVTVVFFLVGLLLMLRVNEREGVAAGRAGEAAAA